MPTKTKKLSTAKQRDLERYRRLALKKGATFAKLISPRTVKTAEWVRMKCTFGCSGYGGYLTCPPHSPTPKQTRKMLKDYSAALLIAFQFDKASQRPRISRLSKRLVVDLERTAFLDGYPKAYAMASGPCRFCRTCDVDSGCKHPELARPSMEACGIDVFTTARRNGLKINVVRGYKDGVTYCNLLLVD
jgi:predicted metal-binding protein